MAYIELVTSCAGITDANVIRKQAISIYKKWAIPTDMLENTQDECKKQEESFVLCDASEQGKIWNG